MEGTEEKKEEKLKIVLGIDTGGTYTDAVACNARTHEIYAEAKALTTKRNLSEGIYNALSGIPPKYLHSAELISLSTTLATNACVENRGCRALLILFGMDENSARRLGQDFGGFDTEDIWCIDTETHIDGTIGNMPDWNKFADIIKTKYCGYEAFAVVEIYARQTGAFLEKKSREVIKEVQECPVVCGHELFNELNVLKRGANALLNARLVPLIDRFLKAVDSANKNLGINAPVMIVRSDGSLMSREFAVEHPIETLLCGPVASVMGAGKLTNKDNALVVDIGGTTSDVAFIRNGLPVRIESGVHIGGWTTFVKGIFVDTFALGGDTGVHYKDKEVFLDVKRMIPVCILASDYPQIVSELEEISLNAPTHTRFLHEYIVFLHMPENPKDYSEKELKIIEAVKERPYSVYHLIKKLKYSVYEINTEHIEKDGLVMRSGLTPTDIMHLKGDFNNFCKEASYNCAEYIARNLDITVDKLCDAVYDRVKYRLYRNIGRILMEKDIPDIDKYDTKAVDLLYKKHWEDFWNQNSKEYKFFENNFISKIDIIGLGGPASIIVSDAVKALGVKAFIPKHAQVANALGAALSHVAYVITVTVDGIYGENNISGYAVTSTGERKMFGIDDMIKAKEYAIERAENLALLEAKKRGVKHVPQLDRKITTKNYPGTDMLNKIIIEISVQEKI